MYHFLLGRVGTPNGRKPKGLSELGMTHCNMGRKGEITETFPIYRLIDETWTLVVHINGHLCLSIDENRTILISCHGYVEREPSSSATSNATLKIYIDAIFANIGEKLGNPPFFLLDLRPVSQVMYCMQPCSCRKISQTSKAFPLAT